MFMNQNSNRRFLCHLSRAFQWYHSFHQWWLQILLLSFVHFALLSFYCLWIIWNWKKKCSLWLLFYMVLLQVGSQNRKILTNTWWVTVPEATRAVFVPTPSPGRWSGTTSSQSTFQTRSPTSATSAARCSAPITPFSCTKNESIPNQTLPYFLKTSFLCDLNLKCAFLHFDLVNNYW